MALVVDRAPEALPAEPEDTPSERPRWWARALVAVAAYPVHPVHDARERLGEHGYLRRESRGTGIKGVDRDGDERSESAVARDSAGDTRVAHVSLPAAAGLALTTEDVGAGDDTVTRTQLRY